MTTHRDASQFISISTLLRATVASALILIGTAALARPFTVDDALQVRNVSNAQISPDGEWVAYEVGSIDLEKDKGNNQLWLVSWDGKTSMPLTRSSESASNPQWSPDGNRLAFLRAGDGDNDDDQIWLLDRRGGEAIRLTDIAGGVSDFSWAPDGKRLALLHTPKPAVKKGADDKEVPQPIVIDRYQFKNDSNGYLTQPKQRIYLYGLADKRLEALTTGGEFDESDPTWSPDGQQIAFISNRDKEAERSDYHDIFVVPARPGSTPKQLTDFPGEDAGPLSWSADGKTIAFLRGGEPRYWLYNQMNLAVVPAAGGETRVLSASLDRDINAPEFSSDGRSIQVLVTDNRVVYPMRISPEERSPERLLSAQSAISSFATARGHTVVVASRDDAPAEVYALEKGQLRALTQHNQSLLQEVKLAATEDIDYAAKDGQRVYGLLTLPPEHRAGMRHPTLLWIHGGPYGQDDHSFDAERQLFAANGYAVVQINYRGSNGRGVEFGRGIFADWGNRDVSDLLGGVDHVVAMGVADPNKLAVGGWSQGGILTNFIITQDHRFKAAMSGAGAGNQISLYGSDQYVFGYEQEFGTPWNNTELWLRISAPFFKANEISTPTLYMGGQVDFNVPIIGGEQMYQALKSRRIPTQLVIYPEEHHGIRRPSFVRDRLNRYLAWYGQYLKQDSAAVKPSL